MTQPKPFNLADTLAFGALAALLLTLTCMTIGACGAIINKSYMVVLQWLL